MEKINSVVNVEHSWKEEIIACARIRQNEGEIKWNRKVRIFKYCSMTVKQKWKKKRKKKWWKYNSIPASLELYLLTYTLINYLTEHNEIKGNCIENEITKNSWRTH